MFRGTADADALPDGMITFAAALYRGRQGNLIISIGRTGGSTARSLSPRR
ncbi:MAG: hypothetical protein ACLRVN_04480 [Butyricicoccus sp.]